jgi:hypothetical protein
VTSNDLKGLYKMINNDLFADVYFEIESKRVAAHRNILSFRSDYFKNFLLKHKDRQNPIYLSNIKYDTFLTILTFLYTGTFKTCSINGDCCLDLLKTIELFKNKDETVSLTF